MIGNQIISFYDLSHLYGKNKLKEVLKSILSIENSIVDGSMELSDYKKHPKGTKLIDSDKRHNYSLSKGTVKS